MTNELAEKILAILTTLSARMERIEAIVCGDEKPEDRWWSPEEVAKKVERAPLTVREWARLDKIPSKKDSRGRRWISDEVAQLIFRYQGLPPAEDLVSLKPNTDPSQSVASQSLSKYCRA